MTPEGFIEVDGLPRPNELTKAWDAMVAEAQALRKGWVALMALERHSYGDCPSCSKFTAAVLQGADSRATETLALMCPEVQQWVAEARAAVALSAERA